MSLVCAPKDALPPKTRRPLVSVMVLNHNNWRDTEECLASIRRLDYPNYRLLLVDNGSQEAAPQSLGERFPGVEILANSRNLGFAGGVNRGIRHARERGAEYIWLLNNDTEVEPGSLAAMVQQAEADPKVGAVGSILLNPDANRSLQAWGGGRVNFVLGLPAHLRGRQPGRLDYLCGASLLLRHRAIDQVGVLDPGFFLYWEDADLCFRLRAAGWKLAVAEESFVIHKAYGSTIFQSTVYDYHFTRSSIRFFRRHAHFWPLPVLVSVTGRIICRSLSGGWANVGAVWRGFRDALVFPARDPQA